MRVFAFTRYAVAESFFGYGYFMGLQGQRARV